MKGSAWGCPYHHAASGVPTYDVDFYADDFIRDPQPHYEAMRKLGAIIWLPRHGNFAVTRYHEVREALRNWKDFSSGEGVAADDAGCSFLKGNTLASDPPIHDEMRAAMGAPLLPGALDAVRPQIEAAAAALVDSLIKRKTFDGVADFARVLPETIVTQLVGLPEDGRENMPSWAAASFDILGIQNERGRRGIETIKEMRRWIAEQARPERLAPNSWTARIHKLVDAGQIAPAIAPLLIRDYINPSLDTTISATGQLIYQLGKNPNQWNLLREDTALIPNAMNEAVRLGSPIRSFSRTVARATTIAGVALPAGSRLMILFASANRDEQQFHNPNQFDVTRTGMAHVGFGHGIHMCVGMHLAKLEMEALLKALVARVERIEVGEPTIALNNTIHAFTTLPVTLHEEPNQRSMLGLVSHAANSNMRDRWIDAVVDHTEFLAPDVLAIDLKPASGSRFPRFDAGAHIDVEVGRGMVRQYSLWGSSDDCDRYRIAIAKDRNSRGASIALHQSVKPGATLRIGFPRNHFRLNEDADRSLLFAAGIGITPIIAMARRLNALSKEFELHYSFRTRNDAPFVRELLSSQFADKVTLHVSDEHSRLDVSAVIPASASALHAYVCGPQRFIRDVVARSELCGWPSENLHIEKFSAELIKDGEPFTVIAERSGKAFAVAGNATILSALKEGGIEVESSCLSGVCGTCLTPVVEGEPDHRDSVQTTAEKLSNKRIAVCCSRARTKTLRLDI